MTKLNCTTLSEVADRGVVPGQGPGRGGAGPLPPTLQQLPKPRWLPSISAQMPRQQWEGTGHSRTVEYKTTFST